MFTPQYYCYYCYTHTHTHATKLLATNCSRRRRCNNTRTIIHLLIYMMDIYMHTHARAHAEDEASPASSFFASSLPWSSFVFDGVNRNKRSSDSRLYINASRSLSISHTSSGGWSRLQRLFSSIRRCSSGSRPRSDASVTVARARAPPPPQAA